MQVPWLAGKMCADRESSTSAVLHTCTHVVCSAAAPAGERYTLGAGRRRTVDLPCDSDSVELRSPCTERRIQGERLGEMIEKKREREPGRLKFGNPHLCRMRGRTISPGHVAGCRPCTRAGMCMCRSHGTRRARFKKPRKKGARRRGGERGTSLESSSSDIAHRSEPAASGSH